MLTWLVLAQPDSREERFALAWPIEGPVISTFGRRTRGWHAGIDISAELGSPIPVDPGEHVVEAFSTAVRTGRILVNAPTAVGALGGVEHLRGGHST